MPGINIDRLLPIAQKFFPKISKEDILKKMQKFKEKYPSIDDNQAFNLLVSAMAQANHPMVNQGAQKPKNLAQYLGGT